jgi:hypothetical protein
MIRPSSEQQGIDARPTIYFVTAALALLMGSTVYILWRPDALLMFRWFDALGLHDAIVRLRHPLGHFGVLTPTVFVFSAPWALWLLSYLFCIRAIWHNSASRARHIWFWFLPFISIVIECAQASGFCPGTFDADDILALAVASLIAYVAP